ncbi:MAG: hypothetical protein PHQ86_04995 [Dehalococcoidales bacterium]|nr:hypothetical protein [Dehalococcoidales bacterium]
MIISISAIVSNKGGRKLNLETMLMLRDRKTNKPLYRASLMPSPPLVRIKADQKGITEPVSYCPELFSLEIEATQIYMFYFFVDKFIVDRIGTEEISKGFLILKVLNAKNDLVFIDRGANIQFYCEATEKGNEYICKRSRLN